MAEVKYLDKTGLGTVWTKVKGIVTPKADKVSGATNGNLAGLNSSGNLTDSGLAATNIAQKDGSYSGMTVGAAEDLVSAESVASEFTHRVTGGSTAVGKGGTALVDKIKGRTIVWNQCVASESSSNATVDSSVTTERKYIETLNGSSTSRTIGFPGGSTVPSGHKALLLLIIKSDYDNSPYLRYFRGGSSYSSLPPITGYSPNVWQIVYTIIENGFSPSGNTGILPPGDTHTLGKYISTPLSGGLKVFDLTLMFGAGNEPTVEEFKALYPGLDYSYNPAALINNGKKEEYDIVWNQLFDGSGNVSANGVTFTKIADNTYSIDGTARAAFNTLSASPTLAAGHKYYAYQKLLSGSFSASGSTVQLIGDETASLSAILYSSIITQETADTGTFRYHVSNGDVYDDAVMSFGFIDLTLMFGSGSEPTAAEFEEMFPDFSPAYDTGTQQHVSFPRFKTKIETVGWNQWDEEWEPGTINASTGLPSVAAGIRSKNFCKILPSTTYYRQAGGGGAKYTMFYDASQNFIGWNADSSFQTPSDARYFKISCTQSYGNIYNNDICISLSDPSRNGTYEPYWRSELELGLGDIKVKSHNIWDEQLVVGQISQTDGQNTTGDSAIRSVNYIPVTPGKTYYLKVRSLNSGARVFQYGADKAFLRTAPWTPNSTLTLQSDTHFIRFQVATSVYGTTYTNDICINLSDPAYNGRYEPHGDGGVISITGGLKSAGTAYDEISGGKLVKRIDVEDMTGKAWTRQAYGERYRFYAQRPVPAPSSTENVVCPKYIQNKYVTDGASSAVDKSISIAYDRIYIIDDSYTDTTAFAASLTGVPLYYALAQPIEYELADALPTAMRNDPYGTERRLPEDTAAIVTAPFRADITYSTNIKEAVQSLPQNYINVNSMQDFLAELGTLMGGTWTMRPADGKFDFTFTPNPSNE